MGGKPYPKSRGGSALKAAIITGWVLFLKKIVKHVIVLLKRDGGS